MSALTQCTALTPTFATPTPTADGFTVQITNYDAAFTWAAEVTAGSGTIDDSGLATVTGLTTNSSQTLTVTTTRVGYADGSATVSGARTAPPATPSHWIGAGNFTIEFWVKPTEVWSSRQELFAITPPALDARLDIVYVDGKWEVLAHNWSDGTPPVSSSMAAPAVGTWTHVALTRSSGTMRLYVAGQKVAESTSSADFSGLTKLVLAADVNSSWCRCNLAVASLMSNIRVIDGIALYTSETLTIPTSALSAVAGTTFLLKNALADPSNPSISFDGSMRYEQQISIVDGSATLSTFAAYVLSAGAWQSGSVVTSTESPFAGS